MYEGLRASASQISSLNGPSRTRILKRAALWAVVSSAIALAACSDVEPVTDEASSRVSSAVERCPNTLRYDAFLHPGSRCTNVPSIGGEWVAAPLFPDASENVRRIACAYHWQSSTNPPGPPEADAIRRIRARLVTPNCAQPWCSGEGCTMAGQGNAHVIPRAIISALGGRGGGTNGCDVCGIVDDGTAYLILPEDYDGDHAVVFGDEGYFLQPADSAQSYSVELPPLRNNMAYPDGFITIY